MNVVDAPNRQSPSSLLMRPYIFRHGSQPVLASRSAGLRSSFTRLRRAVTAAENCLKMNSALCAPCPPSRARKRVTCFRPPNRSLRRGGRVCGEVLFSQRYVLCLNTNCRVSQLLRTKVCAQVELAFHPAVFGASTKSSVVAPPRSSRVSSRKIRSRVWAS